MKTLRRHLAAGLLLLAAGFGTTAPAQSARTGAAPRVYRDRLTPHWFAGADGVTNKFWYRADGPNDTREFILVDADAGQRAPAFDHGRVAAALAKLTGRDVDAAHLPIRSLRFAGDGQSVVLRGTDAGWTLNLESYSLTPAADGAAEEDSLPASRTPRRSRNSDTETEITFTNRLDHEVRLFWIDPEGRRVPYGSLPAGAGRAQHTYSGHVWLVTGGDDDRVVAVFEAEDRSALAIIDGRAEERLPRRRGRGRRWQRPPVVSPDGKWEAVVRDHNLVLRDVATGAIEPLTSDADSNNTYAAESESPEVYWAPDSQRLVAMRLRPGSQRRVYVIESAPADQIQPKLDSYPYLKPGDDVPVRKPHLFDVAAKKEIPVADDLFANPWSIGDVRWSADSRRFTFLYNQRGHQVLRIVAVDAATGAARPIVEERSRTFIDYSGKFFCEYLDETGEIIWMSERDGWNHLYLYDAQTGTVKNQITRGEWVVRSVDWVDKARRQIWFQAGGIRPGQDPYYLHLCRVNFDGSGLTILTEGNGTHSAQFSPDRRYFVDTWSRVDRPPVHELRRSEDGKLVCKLEEADAGNLGLPEPFAAKGRDGVTDIYGVIWRPKSFDPRRKYPVIESIYAGPQDSFAPKAFHATSPQQELADDGFIVVQLDGMGTSNRSKKFHDVCWKNLQDAGFPDRILWIKAAAAKYPYMDLTRVGIYGTSAGGQNAMRALLDHGDFYKVAVADCGCHDNRMDKIWWNEQWLGWPVDDSYVRSSNVVDAHKLRGQLLLMVGELDRNVDPASTMQVVNALIKADKDFELLVMPGAGHGVARTPYGWRRLRDFFARNLLRQESGRK